MMNIHTQTLLTGRVSPKGACWRRPVCTRTSFRPPWGCNGSRRTRQFRAPSSLSQQLSTPSRSTSGYKKKVWGRRQRCRECGMNAKHRPSCCSSSTPPQVHRNPVSIDIETSEKDLRCFFKRFEVVAHGNRCEVSVETDLLCSCKSTTFLSMTTAQSYSFTFSRHRYSRSTHTSTISSPCSSK
jgi:hypothetical protein